MDAGIGFLACARSNGHACPFELLNLSTQPVAVPLPNICWVLLELDKDASDPAIAGNEAVVIWVLNETSSARQSVNFSERQTTRTSELNSASSSTR